MSIEKYTIIDLDNCISDDRHRKHYVNEKNYTFYHSLCLDDELVWDIKQFGPFPRNVIIFTGRPDEYLCDTKNWFKWYGLSDHIAYYFMRPPRNNQSQPRLKESYLRHLQGSLYNIKLEQLIMAYDDRQDVLDVYSKYGIPTTLKSIG